MDVLKEIVRYVIAYWLWSFVICGVLLRMFGFSRKISAAFIVGGVVSTSAVYLVTRHWL